jgi:release factor glutamine methyltransferase
MSPLLAILQQTAGWLRERGVPSPQLDAELLLCHVLGVERLQLYLMYDRPMSAEELETLKALMRRRGKREPLAYITGSRGFHTIDLEVRPGVLVPRPDTETLVDACLSWLPEGDDPIYVADVGSGSGAVGLALAAADPRIRVYATDVSPIALDLTRDNARALSLDKRVGVLRGPLLTPIPTHRPVDWVVSNPPYIPTRKIDGLEPEVSRWEPRLALDGGPDGLAVYHALVPAAVARARCGLLVEVGHDQADAVSALMSRHGLTDVQTWDDLGGHTSVVGGRLPSESAIG